jgi:hypothetical protein
VIAAERENQLAPVLAGDGFEENFRDVADVARQDVFV